MQFLSLRCYFLYLNIILTLTLLWKYPNLCTVSLLLYLMVLKTIFPGCGVRASLMLFFYLPLAGREIIKRIPCVCSCVIECVSRFYKGLYITLVVSPWPFQCFLWPYCLCPFIWCCYFTPGTIAKWVIAMMATLSKVLITPKRLHLECFCKIRCSATFSMPTRWYHF